MTQFSLNNCKYGVFKVSSLFDVKGTKTTPLEVLRSKSETKVEFPYVTTKSDFMGVGGFFNYFTEEGNVVVIDSATNGHIHYQISNFSASDHVEKLVPKFKMNFYIAQFFVSSLKYATKNKFNYGYKFNQLRIKNQKVMLPIDKEGNPNFKFMEEYMKNKYLKLLNKYKKFIEHKLKILSSDKELVSLNDKKWESFNISEIFNIESTNSGIDKNKLKNKELEGIFPYITRSGNNNGYNLFVTEQDYDLNEGNVITIGLDTQTVFYQPHAFYTGQNIQILSNIYLNKYNSLFIVTLLKNILTKFNWGGNGATLSRLKKTKVLLPVTSTKTPDYEYMEQYMINLEINLLNNLNSLEINL